MPLARKCPQVFLAHRLVICPGMSDITSLVEALPECEPKGRLRGLATAARVLDERARGEILERMAAVVRDWQEHSPAADLSRELERQLSQGRDG